MTNIKLKKLGEPYFIPSKRLGDAGFDLRAANEVVIQPQKRALVSTNISIEIPSGYYGQISPRSGLAAKNGIDIFAGIIDSVYRGEILVCVANFGENPFYIKIGDKIAQLLIKPYLDNAEFVESDILSETVRASGGFGSTGIS